MRNISMRGSRMLSLETLRAMVNQLTNLPGYSLNMLAKELGVHEKTLRKLQNDDDFHLVSGKQLALVKIYCSMQTQ